MQPLFGEPHYICDILNKYLLSYLPVIWLFNFMKDWAELNPVSNPTKLVKLFQKIAAKKIINFFKFGFNNPHHILHIFVHSM